MSVVAPVAAPDRKRTLLIVLVVVAVAAIPGRIAWTMRSSTLTEASDTREEVRRLDEQVAQARRDEARAGELRDQLQALAAALPAEPDLASVVEQLQAVADESNVTFVSSSQAVPNVAPARAVPTTETTDPDAAGATATSTPAGDGAADATAGPTSSNFMVEIDVTGTKSNLAAFVEKLRSLPRVLTVERLQWTWQEGPTGGADAQVVTAHLSVRAYTWSGAAKAVAAAEGGAATPTTKAP